jgi:hypothetical protein
MKTAFGGVAGRPQPPSKEQGHNQLNGARTSLDTPNTPTSEFRFTEILAIQASCRSF